MEQKYLIFVGIILGALIIGGCVYFGITNKTLPPPAQNNYSISPSQNQIQQEPSTAKLAQCTAKNTTIVTKVIDGDTIVVKEGEHVRLLGIDADEKNYPCYQSAKSRLEALVLNKEVLLQKDITDVDQYQRCLRNVFVGSQNVGLQLVGEGLAIARFYPPDIKYKDQILAAQNQAIENKTGCKWNK